MSPIPRPNPSHGHANHHYHDLVSQEPRDLQHLRGAEASRHLYPLLGAQELLQSGTTATTAVFFLLLLQHLRITITITIPTTLLASPKVRHLHRDPSLWLVQLRASIRPQTHNQSYRYIPQTTPRGQGLPPLLQPSHHNPPPLRAIPLLLPLPPQHPPHHRLPP